MNKSLLKKIYCLVSRPLPYGKIVVDTFDAQAPIGWRHVFWQKLLGFNRKAYWPMHPTSYVGRPKNVICGISAYPGYMPGCYIQAYGKIYVGDYTIMGANVGIITANHNVYNSIEHTEAKDVKLGKYCWIGMNSVILPGVKLGDFTIVGAGSVVTKSFPGNCIIAGNPAKIIKLLEKEKCVRREDKIKYQGYKKAC